MTAAELVREMRISKELSSELVANHMNISEEAYLAIEYGRKSSIVDVTRLEEQAIRTINLMPPLKGW